MILKRLHLRPGKKAMEKLMKPVDATLEGRGVRRGGGTLSHLSYWNLVLHTILDAAAC